MAEANREFLKVVSFNETRFERMKPVMDEIYALEENAAQALGKLQSRDKYGPLVKNFVDESDARTYEWSSLVRRVAGISEMDWTNFLREKHERGIDEEY